MFFGLLFSLLTGTVWIFTGIFFHTVAKRGLSIFNICIMTNLSALLLAPVLLTKTGDLLEGLLPPPGAGYVFFVLAAGFLNMSGSLFLQRAMACGKSGTAWALGQSALIVPFLSLSLIFGETPGFWKSLGISCVIAGMLLLTRGSGKTGKKSASPETEGKSGIPLAIAAFFLLGAAQSMTASTGHLSYADPGNLRPLLTLGGSFTALLFGKILLRDSGFSMTRFSWLLAFLMSLANLLALFPPFLAIDALAKADSGVLFFPAAVGSCIAGYTLYSILVLKEKSNKLLLLGIAAILSGIFCFVLPAMGKAF